MSSVDKAMPLCFDAKPFCKLAMPLCFDAKPFCKFAMPLCFDAKPFCKFAMPLCLETEPGIAQDFPTRETLPATRVVIVAVIVSLLAFLLFT
jgi:hypothetical protein